MRFTGIVLCLIALALTGYSAIVYKAPRIEADIQARADHAVDGSVSTPIDVIVDGRHITLRGAVNDDREKEMLLTLAGNVLGSLGPIDELERLTAMTPYRFEAVKGDDGKTRVEGFAPNDEVRDLIRTDAEAIFGTDIDLRINLAAGVPDGDWRAIAGLGMDALATLARGKMTIVDTELSLVGDVPDEASLEAVEIFAEAAPEGFNWTNDLSPVEDRDQSTGETAAREVVEPFTFTVRKDRDGSLTLSGYAPDEPTKQAFIDQAEAAAPGKQTVADIQLADGMPNADWPELVFAGIGAMAQIELGQYDVIDNEVSFSGDVDKEVANGEPTEEIDAATDEALITAAAVSEDGETTARANAEPEAEAEVIEGSLEQPAKEEAAVDPERAADIETTGRIDLETSVDTAPLTKSDDPGTTDRIAAVEAEDETKAEVEAEAAKGAVEAMDTAVTAANDATGTAGDQVNFLQDNVTAAAEDIAETGDDGAPAEGRGGVRPYVMRVYKADDGGLWIEGLAPDAAVRDRLVASLKDKLARDDLKADINFAKGMPGDDWPTFVAQQATALTTVKSGSLSITDYDAHLVGVVDTLEDIDRVRAELSAIDNGLTADLNPIDPRPAAKFDLVMSTDDGVKLKGNLPEGLSEEETVAALGLHDYKGVLGQNARGSAELWQAKLAAVGRHLPQFEKVDLSLEQDFARIVGTIHAQGNLDQVKKDLSDSLGTEPANAWEISVSTVTYENDARRKNPLTGKEEVYDRGHWLPLAAYSTKLEECRAQSSAVLQANKITFLRGEATLDDRAEKVIDDLAAIAVPCLANGDLSLEIGGHTDSRGSAAMNRELSQARADAVLRALKLRGVGETSLITKGYGDAQPIADNGTDEGRAQNRRITFEWTLAATDG